MQDTDIPRLRKYSLGERFIGVAGPLAGVFLTLYASWIVLEKDIRFFFEQEPSSLEIKADESPDTIYQPSHPPHIRRTTDYK